MDKKNFSAGNLLLTAGDFYKTRAGLFLCFILFAVIAYLPLLYLLDYPCRDVAHRYAPMADAFARGDFIYAFHPRCQSFHTTVAGVIAWISGCGGFTACKAASFLFFLGSVFPLFFMSRRIFGTAIARGAVVLFALTPPLIAVLAASGLRDAAKMFVQLLIAHALVWIIQERNRIKPYLYLGIGCGLAVCTRNELILPVALVLLCCGLLDREKNNWIWRSLLTVTVTVMVSGLEMAANSYICGYFIPGARYYDLFFKTFGTTPTFRTFTTYVLIPSYILFVLSVYSVMKLLRYRWGKIAAAGGLVIAAMLFGFLFFKYGHKSEDSYLDFINSVLKGIFPLFSAFSLVYVFFRIKAGKFQKEEIWLAVLLAIYVLSVIVLIVLHDKKVYVSSRYLMPSIPLLLAWSWGGMNIVRDFLYRRIKPLRSIGIQRGILTGLTVILLYCAYRGELNKRIELRKIKVRQAILQISDMIKKEKHWFSPSVFSMMQYRSHVRPCVYFDCQTDKISVAAYCGGGRADSEEKDQIDVLVTSAKNDMETLKKRFPSVRAMEKVGKELDIGKEKLQVWRITQK